METIIFTKKVLDIVDTQHYNLMLPEPLYIPYNQTLYHYLENEKNTAMQERNAKNNALFRTALYYWTLLMISGVTSYGLFIAYKQYKKRNDMMNIMDRDSDEDLELIQLPLYRKGSIDSQDMDHQPTSRCSGKCKKYTNKAIYYIVCGGCILAFQYAFFQYIVFHYDPLTTAEVEFIIYNSVIQHVQHTTVTY